MEISFEFLKETIEINKNIMVDNADATNDMLVDDILLELGYNRKRDINVKRLYNEELDWNILNKGKEIFVKVIPYNEEVELDNETIDGDIYIKTNGIKLGIAIKGGNKVVYVDLRHLSAADRELLNHLSKEGFNYELLEEITKHKLLTADEVKSILSEEENMREIYNIVITKADADNTVENFETVKSVINSTGKVAVAQAEQDNKELDRIKSELDNANTTIVGLRSEIEQLKVKQEQERLNEGVNIGSEKEMQYRKQIEKLHTEKSEQQDEIARLNDIITELNNKINNDKSNIQKQAYELINAIEDDPELPRSYVGVVNNKLFQEDSLRRFVGICIEKLYELESFNIMPLLFDGDVFKIKQNGEQADFLINTKEYEINLEDETEETVLLKLKALFNKFSNIAFECKTIGTYVEPEEFEEYDEVGVYNSELFDDGLELEGLDGGQAIEGDNSDEDYIKTFLVVRIARLSEVVWHDNIKNIVLKGIAVGNKKYKIDSEESINKQLIQVIDVLLTNTPNFDDSIKTLMQKDFNGVSIAIKESGQNLIGIPFSRVGIDDIESISMIVPIINEIISSLNVNVTTVELFMEADIPSDSPLNKYAVDFGEIPEYANEHECTMTGNTKSMVISGNITDMTLLNSSVTEMYNRVLAKCLAVKTNYLQERLDTVEGRITTFETIFDGFRGDKLSLANALGTIIGTDIKIMSTDESEVSADHYEIQLSGKTVYVSELSAFELTFTLIRLHSYINKNKSIGIQVEIDLGAYDFYKDKLVTTNTRQALSVYTIINYIKTRLK